MILENKIILKNIKTKILNRFKQSEIAEKMGVTPPTLNVILKNLENGKGVTTTTLNKICTAGNITIQDLFEK